MATKANRSRLHQPSRRAFCRAAASPVLSLFAATKLPNIVLILADDLGYGDLRCYNAESKIPSPRLDRLASEGVRFTDAHTPSAVCTPTRYGLLTGHYCWRTRLQSGVLDGFDPPLIEPGRMTLASLLRGRGYATACIGKWHLGMQWTDKAGHAVPTRPSEVSGFRPGHDVDYSKPIRGGPLATGFDSYFGISASLDMSPYCYIENDRTVGIPDVRTPEDKNLYMNQVPGVRTRDFELSGVMPAITRRAVDYIKASRPGKPFFLYMPLSAPHLPVVPNPEFEGRSKAGRYGDFVAEMDASVGSVLDALDSSGATPNTLVIFTSDNGGLWHWWDFREADDVARGRITPRGQNVKDYRHQSNGRLRGTKADSWEGGHRVPLIVRWPGKTPAGKTADQAVSLVDWLATVAAICGERLPANAGEDSFNLLPAILNPSSGKPVREDVVYHSLRGDFSICREDWKLIERRGSGGFSSPVRVDAKPGEPSGQLYNVRLDPGESRNVYAENPEVVARLTGLLNRYRTAGRTRVD